ncbi:MAG: MBL fold metallo-hydrolase [Betaproteobacteria bacterium]
MTGKPQTAKSNREIRLKFWGVRGSYPTVDRASSEVGGNTSCVEVQVDGRRLIFDAGTGIIPLGKELCNGASVPAAYIFLSHTHIDHVMGLCFFEPLLTAKARTFILGPGGSPGALTRSLHHLTHSDLFPVSLDELKGKKEIFSLAGGEIIRFGLAGHRPKINPARAGNGGESELRIATYKSPAHPLNGVMLYRVFYDNKSFVYATDIEEQDGGYPEIVEFARGADLLIHDGQYLPDEYFSRTKPRKGWGHSTIDLAIEVAKKAGVKRLALFHHEPTHDDKTMAMIEDRAKQLFESSVVAHEGMEIVLR